MTQDWQAVMDEATTLAAAHGLEFHELRNEFGRLCVEEDAEFYEGHGVTASDMNHMLYGGMKARREEVEDCARKLGERNALIDSMRAPGQSRADALEGIRRLLAPGQVTS